MCTCSRSGCISCRLTRVMPTVLSALGLTLLLGLGVTLATPTPAEAQGFHGISVAKSCNSPAHVGEAYTCTYLVSNGIDTGTGAALSRDTLVIDGLSDAVTNTVPIISSPVVFFSSPTVLPVLVANNGAFCTVVAGVRTSCTLPGNSGTANIASISFGPVSIYPVIQPVDASHPTPIIDQLTVNWHDTCDTGSNNCSGGPQTATAPGSAVVVCPVCTAANECNTALCDATTGLVCVKAPKAPSTACGDTDGNNCTAAGCETIAGLGQCVQTHTTTTCTPANECNTAACDAVTHACVQTPKSPSTACGDTDGNNCTAAGCETVAGLGQCVQAHQNICRGCLTLTPGYWGNHLDITACFLPVDSCGIAIDNVGLKDSGSAVEDLCKNNDEATHNQVKCTSDQQLSLIRQCTAAFINLSITDELGGSCSDRLQEIGTRFHITDLLGTCCDAASICTSAASGQTISSSGCIDAVAAFNADSNTFIPPVSLCPATLTCKDGSTLETGDPNCAADSSTCSEAGSNNWVNPGRSLGAAVNPKKCE
jgi:hypothetical protein